MPRPRRYCRRTWWSIALVGDRAARNGFAIGGMSRPGSKRWRLDWPTPAPISVVIRTNPLNWLRYIGTATPMQPRPYVLLSQEPDEQGQARWVAGMGGYANDHVEANLEGIHRRALEVGSAEIAELAEKGELIGSVTQYHFPHNQRRLYQKMRTFPAGYLVMGDAIASFNPVYGQGMTVAVCEAMVLRNVLTRGKQRLARDFFRAAAKVVDIPWQLAVGADLALPQVPGPRPFPTRLINAYVGRVQKVATEDPQVAAAFVKVMHLLASPQTLFAPAVAWRLLPRRQPPLSVASSPYQRTQPEGPTPANADGNHNGRLHMSLVARCRILDCVAVLALAITSIVSAPAAAADRT